MAGGKYRHEYKYICGVEHSAILKTHAQGLLQRDAHAGKSGNYRIRSLYFDDFNDSCYYENESGIGERSKYRIRIYNGDLNYIMLEKKTKYRGMTRKTAEGIDEECCKQLMNGRAITIKQDMSDVLKLLLYEMQIKNLKPKVIVEYVRTPYTNKLGNVRVTFDEAISSSNSINRFLEQDIPLRPIMERGQEILEVKWDEFLPDHIKEALQLDSLRWSSFSKYYLCRKYNTHGGSRV